MEAALHSDTEETTEHRQMYQLTNSTSNVFTIRDISFLHQWVLFMNKHEFEVIDRNGTIHSVTRTGIRCGRYTSIHTILGEHFKTNFSVHELFFKVDDTLNGRSPRKD